MVPLVEVDSPHLSTPYMNSPTALGYRRRSNTEGMLEHSQTKQKFTKLKAALEGGGAAEESVNGGEKNTGLERMKKELDDLSAQQKKHPPTQKQQV
jgi:hypothetical protein